MRHITTAAVAAMAVMTALLLSGCGVSDKLNRVNAETAFENGEYSRAITLFDKCEGAYTGDAKFYMLRGDSYLYTENYEKSLVDYEKAVTLGLVTFKDDPSTMAYYYLSRGLAYDLTGAYAKSVADYEAAMKLDASIDDLRNNLGWILSTCVDKSVHNPARAIEVSLEECAARNWQDASAIDTLAAAYARKGDFKKAVETQQKAVTLETSVGGDYLEDYQSRLELYQEKQPFTDIRDF